MSIQSTEDKLKKLALAKELKRAKNKVLKKYPGAYCRFTPESGIYEIVTENGYPITNPELRLPPYKSVREAWHNTAMGIWFTGMVVKSHNAFNEEKIFRQFAKIKDE